MPQKLVTLRQMQNGVGVITALSLGITVPGSANDLNNASYFCSIPLEVQIGEMGENAYDLALASNWKSAGRVVSEIENIGTQLPANEDGEGLRNRFGLFRAIFHLETAIAAKNKWEAAWAANRITLFAFRLCHSFSRKTPFELIMLGVSGRDLQVASARNDEVAFHKAIGSLHLNWRKIRPCLLNLAAKNGSRNAHTILFHFDNLLQRAGALPDTKNMGDEATLILMEIGNVRHLFNLGANQIAR